MSEININNLPPEVATYIQSLKKEVSSLKEKIENLNEMLVKSKKMMFEKSSEQLKYLDGADQISFFNEAEKEYNAAAPESKEKRLSLPIRSNLSSHKKNSQKFFLIVKLLVSLIIKIALNSRSKQTRLKLSKR